MRHETVDSKAKQSVYTVCVAIIAATREWSIRAAQLGHGW